MRSAQNAVGKIVGDQSLVVVGKDQCIKFLQCGKQNSEKLFLGFSAELLAALVIDANHLLMPRDDPRFHGGGAFGIGDDPFVPDVRGAKTFLQGAPSPVTSN